MFFILKLMLVILLNETYAYITQDVETILLPTLNSTSAEEISLTLKVFGTQIQLNLHRSDQNVSSMFKKWKYDAKRITEELSLLDASDPCYYFHKDHISTAAINFCQEHGWEGFVFLKDKTLEIKPLRHDFASSSSINNLCITQEINISFGKPHQIKKSLQLSADTSFHNLDNFKLKRRYVQNTQKKLTIELAVFFDEAAYRIFMPFLDNDEQMLHMLILAYVNNIQAVFHHPSLGVSIDISLVYLEIMNKQPSNLPVYGGDDLKLLYSFCNYMGTLNPTDDNDPDHWDVGLYLTGINLCYTDQGVVENSTLGISNKNSACKLFQSCVIAEFGIADVVSSGFSSSLSTAHEIGHVLGMRHDSDYTKPCDTYKYIMSSRKFRQGQVTWSECSRNIAEKLWKTKKCLRDRTKNLENAYDHARYKNLPGRQWSAKAQCEIFFRDKDANVVSLLDICQTLQCETPNKKGFYFTGPALEGTYCAPGKECRGGECVPYLQPPLDYYENDNWSEWKESPCRSNCLEKSKGVKVKRRSCKHGIRRTASCKGPYYNVVLCDDSILCTKNRTTASQLATNKCIQINNYLKHEFSIELESGPVVQVLHNVAEPWKACTVHCRKKDSPTLYALRFEMIGVNMNPYLPDGTWCHNKDGQDYYCRQHYCIPESYS
ncbi:A disintegrin and metalloproteinase with thrombospondin motifs adt-2-like [Linepithema humile]|uniref:A disintegrin and metalloproteinase with thrombospondin motifs adt-2-like n=1 Tax=Linepithema humile TaxID=83485 RepID=UPI00351EB4D6